MIPQDPVILLGYINMKLRDEYATLQDFCLANDVEKEAVIEKLAGVGFQYDENTQQFR